MPVKTLREFASSAIAEGLDPKTPAIAVARATRADETSIATSIAELPDRLASASLPGPVVVMIGRAFAELTLAQGVATVASSESTFKISS